MLWKSARPSPSSTDYRFSWIDSINQVDKEAWDRLAMPLNTPFLEWDWLANLENSGCAVPQQGWLANHLLVWQGEELVAAAPLYLKGHSYGEFVFDHQWADLSHRLGLEYYPKLVGMSPFTPATGYRFLGGDPGLTQMMLTQIDHFCDRHQISGCHFLFVDPSWRAEVEAFGYSAWMHHSYIWQNQGFANFDAYLASFNANQRRNIKRERKAIANTGLEMRVYAGKEIPASYFGFMYELYSSHCDKFWGGSKYLNRQFFQRLAHTSRDRLVFVAGELPGANYPTGMSMCIRKGDYLFGRYWGCVQEIDCLHFNTCYYSPIEWAIAQEIKCFDPGAGGEHKKRRGFPATANYSLHRLYRDRLRQILLPHIHQLNSYQIQQIEAINQELPFNVPEPALESSS
ncbi:MAG: GNAT family N-acetyltransferase [Pseudanabaenaceae cyanobacterium bins.68]|nr:GNAT family N-acetyltransferase [Pseudanabaenaceae cyanobacterium bins.68]